MVLGWIIAGIAAVALAATALYFALKNAEKDADKNSPTTSVGETKKECPLKKYKVIDLKLVVNAPSDKLFMNIPERKVEVSAVMTYTKSSDPNDLDSLPEHVMFSFSDPAPDNTKKVDSYKYNAKYLGKKDDATAKYWEAHSECSASSDDSFKTCKVKTKTLEKDKKEIAKVYFMPSGVGADDFKLKATLFSKDGKKKIKDVESNTLVVWRKIALTAYEMNGKTHVSTHGTTAKMNSYYTNDTYVEYELGTVTAIAANKSVKYIGLWDHGTTAKVTWSTHSAKKPGETPTATETTKANGAAGPDRTAARNNIQTKADTWRDRIINQYNSGLNNWASDAGVAANALVAIEYEHPKYSAAAPNSDSVTNQWSAFPWLRITVEGQSIHPDSRWIRGQGLAYGNRAYITSGMSAARTEVAIAHEAGHETKNQFKRKPFGAGDHSSSAGLMDPTGSLSSFTAGEKKILRGFK